MIVGPTSPCVALPIGRSRATPRFGELANRYMAPNVVAGLPGISIPCGFSSGLPVGLQIIGPLFAEQLILNVAFAYEQATEWHKMQSPLITRPQHAC